jgi:hypothetical protein
VFPQILYLFTTQKTKSPRKAKIIPTKVLEPMAKRTAKKLKTTQKLYKINAALRWENPCLISL